MSSGLKYLPDTYIPNRSRTVREDEPLYFSFLHTTVDPHPPEEPDQLQAEHVLLQRDEVERVVPDVHLPKHALFLQHLLHDISIISHVCRQRGYARLS